LEAHTKVGEFLDKIVICVDAFPLAHFLVLLPHFVKDLLLLKEVHNEVRGGETHSLRSSKKEGEALVDDNVIVIFELFISEEGGDQVTSVYEVWTLHIFPSLIHVNFQGVTNQLNILQIFLVYFPPIERNDLREENILRVYSSTDLVLEDVYKELTQGFFDNLTILMVVESLFIQILAKSTVQDDSKVDLLDFLDEIHLPF